MFYQIYYDTKHLSSGNWVVYSTEYVNDKPGETKIIFTGLNSTEARKACAALRKALANGKRSYKTQLARKFGAS